MRINLLFSPTFFLWAYLVFTLLWCLVIIEPKFRLLGVRGYLNGPDTHVCFAYMPMCDILLSSYEKAMSNRVTEIARVIARALVRSL